MCPSILHCFEVYLLLIYCGNFGIGTCNRTEYNSKVKEWILMQGELCPYISLCELRNSSKIFNSKFFKNEPCCFQCSCEPECRTDGTCCPDYEPSNHLQNITQRIFLPLQYPPNNQTGQIVNETNGKEQKNNLTNNVPGVSWTEMKLRPRQKCVSVKVKGRDKGYIMVSKCPEEFENQVVSDDCEAMLNINTATFIEKHIPVVDRLSGIFYKNIFCLLCNGGSAEKANAWDVWTNCVGKPFLDYYILKNAESYAHEMLKSLGNVCDIEFSLDNEDTDIITKPEECQVGIEAIDTCPTDNVSEEEIKELCETGFVWPIAASDYTIYQNIACLQCNMKKFEEKCKEVNRNYSFGAKLDINQNFKSLADNINRYQSEIAEIDFPFTSDRQKCPKGYMYDKQKVLCRHVLCPKYFFVHEGLCVPLFKRIRGLIYQLLLEIILPENLMGASTSAVNEAIFTSVLDKLTANFDRREFGISLWTNESLALSINSRMRCALLLDFSDSVLFKDIIHFSLRLAYTETILEIRIRDNERTVVYSKSVLHTKISPTLYLTSKDIRSAIPPYEKFAKVRNEMLLQETNLIRSTFFISQSMLCYGILLYDDEFEKRGSSIYLYQSKLLLLPYQLTRVQINESLLTIVCKDNVFPTEVESKRDQSSIKNRITNQILAEDLESAEMSLSVWLFIALGAVTLLIVSTTFLLTRRLKARKLTSEHMVENKIEEES